MQDLKNNVFSHHKPSKNSVTAVVSRSEESTACPQEQFTVAAVVFVKLTEICMRGDVMQRTPVEKPGISLFSPNDPSTKKYIYAMLNATQWKEA